MIIQFRHATKDVTFTVRGIPQRVSGVPDTVALDVVGQKGDRSAGATVALSVDAFVKQPEPYNATNLVLAHINNAMAAVLDILGELD